MLALTDNLKSSLLKRKNGFQVWNPSQLAHRVRQSLPLVARPAHLGSRLGPPDTPELPTEYSPALLLLSGPATNIQASPAPTR
jgi:hypothetical protein